MAIKTNLESFVIERLPRSEIRFADYNPRVITDESRRRLGKGLARFGLLAPVTWNRRTGNLVGGHQRVRELDRQHGSQSYDLHVAVVDMDEDDEKAANLLLNNQEAAGDWDMGKLADQLRDLDRVGKIELAGFDDASFYRLFGESPSTTSKDDMDELSDRVAKMQESFDAINALRRAPGRQDYYMVLVFKDYAARVEFCRAAGLDDNRYVDGRVIAAKISGGGV